MGGGQAVDAVRLGRQLGGQGRGHVLRQVETNLGTNGHRSGAGRVPVKGGRAGAPDVQAAGQEVIHPDVEGGSHLLPCDGRCHR